MSIFSVRSFKLVCAAAGATVALNACTVDNGGEIIEDKDTKIEVPVEYAFESRFDAGISSVDHSGQTVRQLLINDIENLIAKAKTTADADFYQDFLELYEYDDASNMATTTSTGTMEALVKNYSEIATGKNLSSVVTSEYANYPVIGYDKTADELLREWAQAIQANIEAGKSGNDICIDEATRLNYQELIGKVLHGAVSYSQGTAKYLVKSLLEDNTQPKSEGAASSAQEHEWDEAFGYFGAAADFYHFSDADLAGEDGKVAYADLDGDNKIDFHSEYNFSIARYAARRDLGSQSGTDFTKDVFDALLEGRTAIVNQEKVSVIEISARKAAESWEKVLAANAVHYINEVMVELDGDLMSEEYSEHWSEMKGFLIDLQYGTVYSLIQDSQLETIQSKVGNQPVITATEVDAYKTDLLEVRSSLQEIYGFDAQDVENW